MGAIFTAEFDLTVASAGGDTTLWEIDPAADKPVTILGMEFAVTSEIAEAQEEWIRCKMIRYIGGTFTSSGGTPTTITPRPLDELNTVAFGGAVEANGSTRPVDQESPGERDVHAHIDLRPALAARRHDRGILAADSCRGAGRARHALRDRSTGTLLGRRGRRR